MGISAKDNGGLYEYFFINNQYHRLTDQSVRHIINRYTDDFHITDQPFL